MSRVCGLPGCEVDLDERGLQADAEYCHRGHKEAARLVRRRARERAAREQHSDLALEAPHTPTHAELVAAGNAWKPGLPVPVGFELRPSGDRIGPARSQGRVYDGDSFILGARRPGTTFVRRSRLDHALDAHAEGLGVGVIV